MSYLRPANGRAGWHVRAAHERLAKERSRWRKAQVAALGRVQRAGQRLATACAQGGRSLLQGTSRRALALSPARAPGRPGRVPRSILCAQNAAVQHAPAMRQHRDARAPAQTSSAHKLHMLRHHGLSAPCGEAHGLLKDECGLAVRHLRLALLLLLSSEAALPSQQASGRPRTLPASTATASRGTMAWVCAVWSTTTATRCARAPEDEAEQQRHQRPVHAHSRRRARC